MDHTLTAPPPVAPQQESQAIAVEIYDQIYHLRGTDPAYIQQLAQTVDGNTVDSLRVAVLAALNIADELHTSRERFDKLAGSLSVSQVAMRSRAGSLAGLLDEVLEDRKVG
jgi:cell division protein ZapA